MSSTDFSAVTAGGVPLTGALGLLTMSGGKVFFVDPQLGADGNDGSAEFPKASLSNSAGTGAYDNCVSGRGDIVVLKGGPTSTSTTGHTLRLSSAFTWSKNNTHLVGLCAPTAVGQRARITGPSTGGTFSPLFTISGSGCRFENITLFDDYGVDPVCLKVTGSRNYFRNVNIQGMGLTAGAADAAGRSLHISGGSENTFDGCTIGLDTILREAANTEIDLDTSATRNIFRKCLIVSYAGSSGAGHVFVRADTAGDIDRYLIFDECVFLNATKSGATAMTNAMEIHTSAGGLVIVKNCLMFGATDWNSTDAGSVIVDQLYDGSAMTKQGGIGIAALR